jgi:hypothetical protein
MVSQTMPSAACWAAKIRGIDANIAVCFEAFRATETVPIPARTPESAKLPVAEKHMMIPSLR